jgi:Domain of unknown function (DUF4105)
MSVYSVIPPPGPSVILRFFIYFFLALFSSHSFAEAEASAEINSLVKQSETLRLAQHPYWLALMHYKPSTPGENIQRHSEVTSTEFFLSADGRTNSPAELTATIAALFKPVNVNSNDHAQCRFVARYQWLRKVLNWDGITLPLAECKNFNAWQKNGRVESISLIFATGYLSNPASFYGHILLKFNADRKIAKSNILDESINFGAIVPENENGLVYVVKGLFGGYDASFSSARFYQQNHMYAENELRDMWEYELALSANEVNQIVQHSWELLSTKFTYYFLDKNCAYSMAELLELVIDQPLLPKTPWSIPINVFNRMESLTRNGAPLVRNARLIPSRLNSYHAKYAGLNAKQRTLVKSLTDNTLNFDHQDYADLNETEKIGVTNTLIDYFEFRIIEEKNNAPFKKAKQQSLLARAKLASESLTNIQSATNVPRVSPPHEGPKPSMIRLSLLNNAQLGPGIELRFRPTYFDLLSLDAGRLADSNVTMFDVKTIYADGRLSLRSLDLVNIETLNIAQTPLTGDGGWAWKVKFGFDSQDLSCSNCMTFNATGGIGKAMQLSQRFSLYGLTDFFAQTSHQGSGTLGAAPRFGLIGTPVNGWKSNLSAGEKYYFNGSKSSSHFYRWENRLGNQRDWDIRIAYEKQNTREVQIGVSTYW